MTPLLIALALVAAQPEPAPSAPDAPAPAAYPAGAPHGDYPYVGWCYGALRGYLDLHDQVMPEVTRIESTYRKPGTKLSDDLKVYADMQKAGRAQLKLFQGAMTAAEKASLRPINTVGAAGVQQGLSVWKAAADVPKARLAQEWMSWTLPDRCEVTARALEKRATLLGASFKVNAEPEPQESRAAASLNEPPPPAPN